MIKIQNVSVDDGRVFSSFEILSKTKEELIDGLGKLDLENFQRLSPLVSRNPNQTLHTFVWGWDRCAVLITENNDGFEDLPKTVRSRLEEMQKTYGFHLRIDSFNEAYNTFQVKIAANPASPEFAEFTVEKTKNRWQIHEFRPTYRFSTDVLSKKD